MTVYVDMIRSRVGKARVGDQRHPTICLTFPSTPSYIIYDILESLPLILHTLRPE